jgi:hypothetical protein
MSHLTLNDLLPGRGQADAKEMHLAGLKNMTPSLLGFINSKVEEVVEASLSADVLGLIAHAWTKVSALQDAAEAGRQRQATQYVFLGEHELDSEVLVKVMVEFGLAPGAATAVAPVTDALTVKVTARFESAGLSIDNGCIVAVETGRASAKAELRYSSQKLLGSSSDWMSLPGKFRLEPPVPISRSSAPAEATRPMARSATTA